MTTPRTRPTYDRWQRATERAEKYGIVILEVHGDHYVTSSRDGLRRHRTDGTRCDCAAGQGGDTCCLHNAAVGRFLERVEELVATAVA